MRGLERGENPKPRTDEWKAVRQDELAAALGELGYRGFAYLRSHRAWNPAEVLLRSLTESNLDSRLAEALPWVVALEKARPARGGGPGADGEGAAPVPDPPASPEPAIKTIAPYIVTQGPTATVTVNGLNFVRRSTVMFKGKAMPTQVVSPTQLKFTLDTAALATAGRFDLSVVNPAPVDTFYARGMWGMGTSNTAHLIVNYKY